MESKRKIKCWNFIFQITNSLNFLYSLFLLGIFAYFVAKNHYQDAFTISFILFFIFYALTCVIGYLWTKKSLFLNYIYVFLISLIYLIFLIFEWIIVFDVDSFKNILISVFKNSEQSANAIYNIIVDDLDSYIYCVMVNTVLFV